MSAILPVLIARSARYAVPVGCERIRIRHAIHLAAGGYNSRIETYDPPREVIVPAPRRTSNVVACTAIDDFTYVLGAANPRHPIDWVTDRVRAYRNGLARLAHPAARAVERFLDDPLRPLILPDGANETAAAAFHVGLRTGGSVNVIRLRGATPKARVLIEVEGHPEWWIDPIVRQIHAAALSTGRPGEEACSICGQQRPLARLYPQSQALHAKLVSFDGPAWCAYGRAQGENVPTCEDCAAGIARGIDALMIPATSIRYDTDAYVLAWADHAADFLPGVLAADVREIPDGHFASIEVNQGRIALRRHASIDGAEVGRRLEAWRRICAPTLSGDRPIHEMAAALTAAGARRRGKDRDVDYALRWERIAIMLLTGEGLPARDAMAVRRLAEGLDYDDPLRVRRLAFLRWAQACVENTMEAAEALPAVVDLIAPLPGEETLAAPERAALNCGRVLSRADTLQNRRAKTQRSVRHTHFAMMGIQPVRCLALLRRYGTLPQGREDRAMTVYLQRAFDALPDRFDQRDQAAFSRGFYAQQAIDHPPKKETP